MKMKWGNNNDKEELLMKTVAIKVPDEAYQNLKAIAKKSGIYFSRFILNILVEFLKKIKEEIK